MTWSVFQRNPTVGKYRNRKFQNFEKLTFTWGKDRATGNNALPPDQAQEEAQQEMSENQQANSNDQVDSIIDQNIEVDRSTEQRSIKRWRTSYNAAKMLSQTMKESSKMMVQVSKNICKSFFEARRESSNSKAAQESYAELQKLKG